MIASVTGRVAALAPDSAIVEVGGVGIQVMCTPSTLAGLRVAAPASLATALVVREDSLTLYGFLTADERSLFELLQTATGVGPRLAQAILAVHGPNAIRVAVATEDVGALTLVPGIGRKGAQRLLLELKDRLGAPDLGDALPGQRGPTAAPTVRVQVREALLGLGYAAREADEAVRELPLEIEDADIATALKSALRSLERR